MADDRTSVCLYCRSHGAGLLYHVTFHMGFTPFYLMCRRKDESKESKYHGGAKESTSKQQMLELTEITFHWEWIEAMYVAVKAVGLFL